MNSSAETHGNSTTSTSTFPTSSPTKKNIHQPSPIKHGFSYPNIPTPKPQQHSKSFQSPTASCPTSPCSPWPPRCYSSPRCLQASPCARPWPRWKQRRHRRRRWKTAMKGMDQLGLMGSDLASQRMISIYEMRNMCLKPIFFIFSLWFYFGAPLILTKITMIGTEVQFCSKTVGCLTFLN